MSSIQAGDVVVCVDDSPARSPYHIRRGHRVPVAKGKIYRVRELAPCERGEIGIRLFGVALPKYDQSGTEIVFRADRFRKVQKADDSFIAQIKACRPRQRDRVLHNVESDRG